MVLTGTFRVLAIKKKTTAKFFSELNVGDEFTLVYTLNGFYGGSPSIDILVGNDRKHYNNATQLRNNLSNFELLDLNKGEI